MYTKKSFGKNLISSKFHRNFKHESNYGLLKEKERERRERERVEILIIVLNFVMYTKYFWAVFLFSFSLKYKNVVSLHMHVVSLSPSLMGFSFWLSWNTKKNYDTIKENQTNRLVEWIERVLGKESKKNMCVF